VWAIKYGLPGLIQYMDRGQPDAEASTETQAKPIPGRHIYEAALNNLARLSTSAALASLITK
jgi:hypothetical protein